MYIVHVYTRLSPRHKILNNQKYYYFEISLIIIKTNLEYILKLTDDSVYDCSVTLKNKKFCIFHYLFPIWFKQHPHPPKKNIELATDKENYFLRVTQTFPTNIQVQCVQILFLYAARVWVWKFVLMLIRLCITLRIIHINNDVFIKRNQNKILKTNHIYCKSTCCEFHIRMYSLWGKKLYKYYVLFEEKYLTDLF